MIFESASVEKLARFTSGIFLFFFGLLLGILFTIAIPVQIIKNQFNLNYIFSLLSGYFYLYSAYQLFRNKRNNFKTIIAILFLILLIQSGMLLYNSIKASNSPDLIMNLMNMAILSLPLIFLLISYKSKYSMAPVNTTPQYSNEPFASVQYTNAVVRGIANIIDQLVLVLPVLLIFYFLRFDIKDNIVLLTGGIIYFMFMITTEALYGQTLGKYIFHIKVTMDDGRPCTIKASIIRNIGRILDMILGSYLLGIIFILVTKKKQRIGDLLAHTVVVKA